MDSNVRLAIISDIHCHKRRQAGQSSFLLTNTPKKPIKQNPLASLIELIDEKKMKADLLILPGDFCDQMDEDGFNYTWAEIQRIASKLEVKDIIPTLGNHDVNSRDAGNSDVFRFARNMDKDFPFRDEKESTKFWNDGYLIKEFPELELRVLVINSAHHHYSLPEARKGLFSDIQREKLEKELLGSKEFKHQVVVSHHHPIPHEDRLGGSEDLMVNGSILLDILVANRFKFYIHGHKHDIRIKYSPHGTDSLLVFSSGSFSRHPYPSLSLVLNAFHVVNLENSAVPNCSNQGFIETYFFAVGTGFQAIDSMTFPHIAGFGCHLAIETIVSNIFQWVIGFKDKLSITTFMKSWDEVLNAAPEIRYLPPEQFREVVRQLQEKGVKFLFTDQQVVDSIMYKF